MQALVDALDERAREGKLRERVRVRKRGEGKERLCPAGALVKRGITM